MTLALVKKTRARLTFLGAALIGLAACATGDLRPVGENGFRPEEDEARLWKESRELQSRFDRSGLVYEDAAVTAYVISIASKLIPARVSKEISFTVKILKHPTPNAFALPHGAFYIHSGMIAQLDNEAQLAAVIGHEVSHIMHRHTVQSFRTVRQAAAFGTTLGVIGAPAGLYGLGVVLLGAVGTLAAVSGYSQGLEEEADTEGLRLLAQAGYDPREATKAIENLQRYVDKAEIKEPFFFSTHPRLAERLASYERLLRSEYAGRTGHQNQKEFASVTRLLVWENASLEIARGRFNLAQESIEKTLALAVDDPKGHFLLAEVCRQRNQEGDAQRAETEYRSALELQPKYAEAHRGIGMLYYKRGQSDLAAKHFKNYLEYNPAAKDRAYIDQYLREIEPAEARP